MKPDKMKPDTMFQSPIHRKIIVFFHENQSSIDTPRGVSAWIREERSAVKKALEDLVIAKVLIAHRATSITGYSYTTDTRLMRKIEKFLKTRRA